MGPFVRSLLAACVVVCVTRLTPVQAQCTTKQCTDDDGDKNVLMAMMARLHDTVADLKETVDQQEQQYNNTVEQLRQDHQRSTEQLLQLVNHSMAEQQQQLARFEMVLAKEYASNCADLLKIGYRTSGVYYIYLARLNKKVKVFCDQDTENGGWTVFQRRQDGSVDFNRDWTDYKEGFGDVAGEFWLGNDNLHEMTSHAQYTLRVDLTAFNGSTAFAEYTTFAVAAESAKYRLSVGGYHGNAGDSMTFNDGWGFTTPDRDNDRSGQYNCAVRHKGAWWYNECSYSYLNGVYHHVARSSAWDGIYWEHWLGPNYAIKSTLMMIRP